MANRQLTQYITIALSRGATEEQIRNSLAANGWDQADITEAWTVASQHSTNQPLPVPKKHGRHLTISDVLLFLGALILVIGALLLIAPNWGTWASGVRILVAVLPAALLIGIGIFLWPKPSMQHAAHIFLVTGGIVLPIAIGITIWELTSGTGLRDSVRSLLTALLSLCAYASAALFYRRLVWGLFTTLAGIAAYISLMLVFDISYYSIANPWAWAFVICGLLLLVAGFLVERSGGRYASRPQYFFGAMSLVISLGVLGISGDLFGHGWNFSYMNPIGWHQGVTIAVIGIIFLALGVLARYLRRISLVEAGRLVVVWDFLGALFVSGAPLFVSTQNHSLVSALLAVILGVAFILYAVKIQARPYLQASSLIIAAAIIKIGADNFSEQASWPVMVMIAGLVIMGGGWGVLKLQRRFIPKTPAIASTMTPPSA